ncbi:MAG TPA: DUF1287 domain-containing protein [Pyrinomonadaceae bacterium]|nr:DUF1287 domain-containing protein [Pyrinomonadaceae bacterium]
MSYKHLAALRPSLFRSNSLVRILVLLGICSLTTVLSSCQRQSVIGRSASAPVTPASVSRPLPQKASPQLKQLIDGAVEQSKVTTGYDPSYVKLDYPNGDVSTDTGVCSDVVVRAFRKAGIDLQKEVHEDMKVAWSEYPKRWGARGTDANIDHRRVLNLAKYFDRQGKSLPITQVRADYLPGDIVAWELSEGVEHIGIMTNLWSQPDQHCLVIHNIGSGARVEDVLLGWKIIGHYRYFQ